ncbi:MAG: hypothetical protein SNI45_01460 [Rikenellaceae bacterium]
MRYFIRAVKYLLMLLVVLLAITHFVNNGEIHLTLGEKIALMMANGGTTRLIFFVLLAALYPLFGYVKREVEGDVEQHEGQITVAMESAGFSLKEKRDGKLYFRANTILRRVAFLFEDVIVVEQRGEKIYIEGIRRGVVYAAFRLEGFIANSKRGEQE